MKSKRLTRRESQQVTRARLVEAAAILFIRSGFEAASVEEIAAEAGYTRGAFYSNFGSKHVIFLEVLESRCRQTRDALDTIFREKQGAAERFQAVRDWYAMQANKRDWAILGTEFHLRALRDREARKGLAKLWRQELDAYTALLSHYLDEGGIDSADDPRAIALSLFAMSQGLGTISVLDRGGDLAGMVGQASNVAFDRLIASPRDAGRRTGRLKDKE